VVKTPSNKEELYEKPLAAMDRVNADLKKKGNVQAVSTLRGYFSDASKSAAPSQEQVKYSLGNDDEGWNQLH
jgi:hypothetical protein